MTALLNITGTATLQTKAPSKLDGAFVCGYINKVN